MAKRKRLTPADPTFLESHDPGRGRAPLAGMTAPKSSPPIADVAADTATAAALEEVVETLRVARHKGLMVLELPLDSVQEDYLVRDRHTVAEEDTDALMTSLRDRGQQTPIEVMEIDGAGYGLISGWRRLTALRRLRDEEAGADVVLALLRRPEQASDAYQAMVEENEIRVGLSYYERARIALKAVDQGVFETQKEALQTLFSSASRAKRSKIKSFQTIVAALDGALRYPQALGERAGLALAKALEANPALAIDLRRVLATADVADSAAELNCLNAAQNQTLNGRLESDFEQTHPAGRPRVKLLERTTCAPGIEMETFSDGSLRLRGNGLDDGLRARLVVWLAS